MPCVSAASRRRLIGEHECLAHLPQRLPDALGELGRALDILDVLLDQLPAIGPKRRIDEFDGGDAIQIEGALPLAHRLEHADDVLLPPDHVERRQLAQPRRRALCALQRIGRVLGLRGQKSEHRFHR